MKLSRRIAIDFFGAEPTIEEVMDKFIRTYLGKERVSKAKYLNTNMFQTFKSTTDISEVLPIKSIDQIRTLKYIFIIYWYNKFELYVPGPEKFDCNIHLTCKDFKDHYDIFRKVVLQAGQKIDRLYEERTKREFCESQCKRDIWKSL